MNYTRKRAILACNFCRLRKRRCDGERPCSTCKESNADCRYKHLPVEHVPSPFETNDRLGRIEALLKNQAQQLQNLVRGTASLEESYTSNSSQVAIDDFETDAASVPPEVSVDAGRPSAGPPGSRVSQSSFYLAPESAVADVAAVASTSGSSTTSPPAPTPSPLGAHPSLGIDALSGVSGSASHHRQHPAILSHQQPADYFAQHKYNSIPYHDAELTSRSGAASTPGLRYAPSTPVASAASRTVGGVSAGLSLQTGQPVPPPLSPSDVSPHIAEQDQFLIPYEHSTAANTLLSLALVQNFLNRLQRLIDGGVQKDRSAGGTRDSATTLSGKRLASSTRSRTVTATATASIDSLFADFSYPRTYFFDIEAHLPLPPQLDLLDNPGPGPSVWPPPALTSNHPAMLNSLLRNYFAFVHPNAPLFSTAQFLQWSVAANPPGTSDTVETAICLVVWALGALSAPAVGVAAAPTVLRQSVRDALALSLFQPALKIILRHALWEFGPASLTTCRALLLAASYFSHTGRPLHSARMVLMASHHLLRLMEDVRAAELDVPRSGVEPLADHIPLPSSLDVDDGDNMIYFMAEISARRLLNRIHSSLYTTPGSAKLGLGSGIVPESSSSNTTGERLTQGNKRRRSGSELHGAAAAGLSATGSEKSNKSKILPVGEELNRQLED
ncbi:Zn(2)-C6 fungal-type DNA-binding domain protein [Niveomyces insectorum RCEF 264]|uniref:Zn(2)-C6 fungal-type DNA-binding domain protein n=1 Tax=Niveomyces insectorum RCEF 264 TaxID=1081102 RepID=A0A167W379_9HYPO|nr:Zn(2)-C6 fungal-type DNA-binding domain protein [Niveomyces insectorum RCEF 264]